MMTLSGFLVCVSVLMLISGTGPWLLVGLCGVACSIGWAIDKRNRG